MNNSAIRLFAVLVAMSAAHRATAEVIVANCTGMVNFDIYTFDTEEPVQEVALIGMAEVTVSDKSILLTGAFGTYEFDISVGTLYHNGTDTGVYCTYKRK